jgi:hypothetical protein
VNGVETQNGFQEALVAMSTIAKAFDIEKVFKMAARDSA